MEAFDWHQFEDGRIRFSSGTRGNDGRGYQTFEVELPSGTYFGEVDKEFPDEKGDAFMLTVPAFGALRKEDVGGLAGTRAIVQSELDRVTRLLPQLADATAGLDPDHVSNVMLGRYLGRVIFKPGWAKVAHG